MMTETKRAVWCIRFLLVFQLFSAVELVGVQTGKVNLQYSSRARFVI